MARLMRRRNFSGTPEEILAAVRELPEGHRYHVEIIRLDPPPSPEELKRMEEEFKDRRTPEQIQADRERLITPPQIPLPAGKTLADALQEWHARHPTAPDNTAEGIEDDIEDL